MRTCGRVVKSGSGASRRTCSPMLVLGTCASPPMDLALTRDVIRCNRPQPISKTSVVSRGANSGFRRRETVLPFLFVGQTEFFLYSSCYPGTG